MIVVRVEVPFASFRKSYARSFAETYPLPPPATIYGMLLSLVGERCRKRHEGVRMAFAFKKIPHVATTLRKLSRYKYGVSNKQHRLGNAPDYVETLCGVEFLCWVDSSNERVLDGQKAKVNARTLESRVVEAIKTPERIPRYGVLCLGLSDDAVNDVELCEVPNGLWLRLIPVDCGEMELPIWVDHVGSIGTRWQRFQLESIALPADSPPAASQFIPITAAVA